MIKLYNEIYSYYEILKETELLKTQIEAERDNSEDKDLFKKRLSLIYRMRNNAAAALLWNGIPVSCNHEDPEQSTEIIMDIDNVTYVFSTTTLKNILQKDFPDIIKKCATEEFIYNSKTIIHQSPEQNVSQIGSHSDKTENVKKEDIKARDKAENASETEIKTPRKEVTAPEIKTDPVLPKAGEQVVFDMASGVSQIISAKEKIKEKTITQLVDETVRMQVVDNFKKPEKDNKPVTHVQIHDKNSAPQVAHAQKQIPASPAIDSNKEKDTEKKQFVKPQEAKQEDKKAQEQKTNSRQEHDPNVIKPVMTNVYTNPKSDDKEKRIGQFCYDQYHISVTGNDEEKTFVINVAPLSYAEFGNDVSVDIMASISDGENTYAYASKPVGRKSIQVKCGKHFFMVRASWESGDFVTHIYPMDETALADKYTVDISCDKIRPEVSDNVGLGHTVLFTKDGRTVMHILPLSLDNSCFGAASILMVSKTITNMNALVDTSVNTDARNLYLRTKKDFYRIEGIWDENVFKVTYENV